MRQRIPGFTSASLVEHTSSVQHFKSNGWPVMQLTPIHVKRKGKGPGTNMPMALQNIQPDRSIKSQQRRSLASVMSERALRLRLRLDALPDEILETILLCSRNMSLPRVSNLLGKRLSGRATLLRLIICAFHDTWAQWFGIPVDPGLVRGPWTEASLRTWGFPTDGDAIFQTEVLDQPWITIDLLLQAQQTWADKNAQGAWYQHSLPWEEEPSCRDPYHAKFEHHSRGGFSHFNARQCFEADYQQALKWQAFKSQGFLVDPWWPMRDIHPKTRIPIKLITGPWDEEMQRRLFWLYRAGFEISKDHDAFGWELKVQLLHNAILDVSEPNVLVLNCLVDWGFFAGFPLDFVRAQRINLKRRLEWGGDTPEGRDVVQGLLQLFTNLSDHALAGD